MADNDIVILAPPMSVVLCIPPPSIEDEHRQTLINVDQIGVHNDEAMIITCRQGKLAQLRAAGAEVIMLEPDANHWANRVESMSEAEIDAFVDERIEETREDLRLADAGRERDHPSS